MIIYVIEDQTGEYSDNRNWLVKAFRSEQQAKDFVEKVINNPEAKERLYQRICDAYIFKYQAGVDGGIDDVIVVDEVYDEE